MFTATISIPYIPNDLSSLQNYIQESISSLDSLTFDSGSMMLYVHTSVSVTQEQVLSACEGYSNPVITQDKYINFGLNQIVVNTDTYQTVFTHDHSLNGVKLSNLHVRSFLVKDPTHPDEEYSYNIRFVNITSNTVLGENTFTNDIEETGIIQLMQESYTTRQTIEIQARRNSGYGHVKILTAVLCVTDD